MTTKESKNPDLVQTNIKYKYIVDGARAVTISGTAESIKAFKADNYAMASKLEELEAVLKHLSDLNPHLVSVVRNLTLKGANFKMIDRHTDARIAVAMVEDNLFSLIGDFNENQAPLAHAALMSLYALKDTVIINESQCKGLLEDCNDKWNDLVESLRDSHRFDEVELNAISGDVKNAALVCVPLNMLGGTFKTAILIDEIWHKAANIADIKHKLANIAGIKHRDAIFCNIPRADLHHACYAREEAEQKKANFYLLKQSAATLIDCYQSLNRYDIKDRAFIDFINSLVNHEEVSKVDPANLVSKYAYAFASYCFEAGCIETNDKADIRQLQECFIRFISLKFPTVLNAVVRERVMNAWDLVTDCTENHKYKYSCED